MPEIKNSRIVVGRKTFLAGLRLVKHAVEKENSARPILQGIYVHSNGNNINIVAMDSYRMAIFNMPAVVEGQFAAVFDPVLLPEVKKIIAEKITIDMPVRMRLGIGAIVNSKVKVSLIWDSYPDYENIIPKGFESQATFNPKEFRRALKSVRDAMGKSDRFSTVPIRVETKEPGIMRIWVQRGIGIDQKIFGREIPAEIKNPGKIAFSLEYFVEATKLANRVSFNGSMGSPALFSNDHGFKELLISLYI